MAKLTETVKNFLGFNTLVEDYDEYEEETYAEDYYEDESMEETRMASGDDSARSTRISSMVYNNPTPSGKTSTQASSFFEGQSKSSERVKDKQESSRILGIKQSDNNLSVVLSRPSEYKDCTEICAKLRERTTVVINFEHLKRKEDKMRILDFIYGCCYAIDGNAQRISEHVYIVAPYNVDIYDDVGEEEEYEEEISYF